jgi:hypothetical protein
MPYCTSRVILILLCLLTFRATAQISSTFDASDEGWTVSDINSNSPKTITHHSTAGNPGGYASALINSTQPFFWTSPAKFTGNIAYLSYRQNLSFDLQISNTPTQHGPSYGDVMIEGTSGNRIVFTLPSFPAVTPGWASFSVTLDETTAWRMNSLGGALATQQQILSILISVKAIRINGQYCATQPITSGIDNVVLGQRTISPAPVITSVNTLSANAGETITISGSNFNATKANNVVHFSGVLANVISASATTLTVEVPVGAGYDFITVINTATGLSGRSQQKFALTFSGGGGRIIRSSMKPKVDIAMDASAGDLYVNVGDMDGDGWIDLIVTETGLNQVSVLRNLGTGGTISAASFATKVALDSGNRNNVIADFDNDGKLDIAASYSDGFNSYFAVHRNTSTPGNITFETAKLFVGLVYSSSGIQTTDIDGDGLMDLTATHGNGSVSPDFWVVQNISTPGNIQFLASKSYFGGSTLDAAGGVQAGDLTGDGKPEITVTHGFGNRFSIIENTSTPGNISFGTPFSFNESTAGVLIADLDGDGKNDLAWSHSPDGNDLRMKRNIYSGGTLDTASFQTAGSARAPIGYINGGLAAGDINGDGRVDIAQAGTSDMVIYENISSPGSLTSASFIYGTPYGGRATSYVSGPVIADLNGDGKPEVITGTTNNSPVIFIYENENIHAPHISLNTVSPLKGPVGSTVTITGDNFSTVPTENIVRFGAVRAEVQTATATMLTVTVPAGATYAPVSVTRDYLTSRYHLPFSVTYGSGTTFDATSFAAAVSFALSGADYDVEAGDLDNDGKPDIVAEGSGLLARIFRNTHASGTISTGSLTSAGVTEASASNPRLTDIDEDGKIDIVSGNGVYLNKTSSSIAFASLATFMNDAYNSSWEDYDHDGKTDLVGSSGGSARVNVYNNWSRGGAATWVAASTSYLDPVSSAIAVTKPTSGGGTATADFDGDGFAEFVSTNGTSDNLSVWRNAGAYVISTAQFTLVGNLATGDNPGRVYAADLDVDGKVDVVVYNGGTTQNISVFHNQSTVGNIIFNRVDFALGFVPSPSTIADLDGDGRPEIITTSETGDRVSIFKNTSAPGTIDATSFASPVHYNVPNPRAVVAVDLNLDSKPELVVTSAPSSLLVLENAIPNAPVITFDTQPASTYVCEGGSSTNFTASASGTTNITYQWQIYNSGTGAFENIANDANYSGVTTNTLTITTIGSFFSSDYRVRASGDLALDAFSDPASLTVNGLPSQPGATGDASCASPATLDLVATGAADGQYRWYDVAAGGAVLGTNGSFTTPSINTTTTYYVSIADTFCESLRTPVTASINLLTKPTLTFNPPVSSNNISMCDGETQELHAPSGFTIYNWSNGANTSTLTVSQSGTYTLTVEDASGCVSPPSDPVNVTVNPLPTANVTANGTQLTSSAGSSYQWYSFNEPITGETNPTLDINVLEYGVYSVDVTTNGCTTRSADYTYLITDAEVGGHAGIRTYPNPATTSIFIESEYPVSMIELIDNLGRTVKKTHGIINKVNIEDLSSGTYVLIVTSGGHRRIIRIQKNH